MLAPIFESSHKNFAILKSFSAKTIHYSSSKLTNISFLEVCIEVRSFALKNTILKTPLVVAAIAPLVAPMAIFFTVFKVSYIP